MEGFFDRKSGLYQILASSCTIENERYLIDFKGRLKCSNEVLFDAALDVSITNYTRCFHGPFIMVVYDKILRSIIVTQHMFGSPVPFYFTRSNNGVYLTTSLRKAIGYSGRNSRLNDAMLDHYFYNGFLPDCHTLIQGIYKLPQGKNLYLDVENERFENSKLDFSSLSVNSDSELESRYKVSMDNAIINCIDDVSNCSIALSSGYDSNSILYHIKKDNPDCHIDAYSVGGISGVDETVKASEIASLYTNVVLSKTQVSPETLTYIDDIVERLEGNVYERGIFLQYELAKSIESQSILLGECADQVFHSKTYRDKSPETFLYTYMDTPLDMASYVVFKKSSFMLNSFGIEGRYPFLESDVIDVGYLTAPHNLNTKEFHKARCIEMFNPRITELISKVGGSTSLSALFDNDFDCLKEAEKSKFFSENFCPSRGYGIKEAVRDYYLSLLYLESFEKQFCN